MIRKDSTSVKRDAYDFTAALLDDVKGLRIGIPCRLFKCRPGRRGKGGSPESSRGTAGKGGAIVEEFELSLVAVCDPGLLRYRIGGGKFQPARVLTASSTDTVQRIMTAFIICIKKAVPRALAKR